MTIMSIAAKAAPAQSLSKEQIRKHFRKCDKDGNGFLTKQEIKEAFDRLCALFPAYRTRKAIAIADENGDGCVNMKDHEFEALIDYVYNLAYTKVNTAKRV
ncbi:hypothetical protein SLEP1_g21619 [Rubroshorea leprosula]|uniref:EF-hand domain-containing protein n=1 Tax=Rubroshorea leprosula TaxID=152421 RepID=A0AAV5JBX0_9ROSI|nr:hypothetical protein SLEP1_g21619 [Rubroshorea leprosula]